MFSILILCHFSVKIKIQLKTEPYLLEVVFRTNEPTHGNVTDNRPDSCAAKLLKLLHKYAKNLTVNSLASFRI